MLPLTLFRSFLFNIWRIKIILREQGSFVWKMNLYIISVFSFSCLKTIFPLKQISHLVEKFGIRYEEAAKRCISAYLYVISHQLFVPNLFISFWLFVFLTKAELLSIHPLFMIILYDFFICLYFTSRWIIN